MYSHAKHQQTFFDNELYKKGSKAPRKDELGSLEISKNRQNLPPVCSGLGGILAETKTKKAETHELLRSLAAFSLCSRSQEFPSTEMSIILQKCKNWHQREVKAEPVPRVKTSTETETKITQTASGSTWTKLEKCFKHLYKVSYYNSKAPGFCNSNFKVCLAYKPQKRNDQIRPWFQMISSHKRGILITTP